MKYSIIFISALLLFTGCSSKKYFEVDETLGSYESNQAVLEEKIKSFNKDGATLENGQIITKSGVSKFKLKEGFEFINLSSKKVISSNYKDSIYLDDKLIKTDNGVIAAAVKDDTLALIYLDNSIAIYDLKAEKITMKEYFSTSLANDTRIANPYFMNNIILFPTLDGKVVVVSTAQKKIVKNIVVDANGKFNNIIFLNVVNDTLIAATTNKIVSVGAGTLNVKEYNIRNIITKDENIYISTIDGQIIKTDISLNILNRKKYKYAKFYALAYGKSLYALESQGYLINIADDFKSDKIYDFSFDNEEKVIAIDDIIYYGQDYIILK